jgi:hypothetical protein
VQYERSSSSGPDALALLAEELGVQQLKEAVTAYGVLLLISTRRAALAAGGKRPGSPRPPGARAGGRAPGGAGAPAWRGAGRAGGASWGAAAAPAPAPAVAPAAAAATPGEAAAAAGAAAAPRPASPSKAPRDEGLTEEELDDACEAFLARRLGVNVSRRILRIAGRASSWWRGPAFGR